MSRSYKKHPFYTQKGYLGKKYSNKKVRKQSYDEFLVSPHANNNYKKMSACDVIDYKRYKSKYDAEIEWYELTTVLTHHNTRISSQYLNKKDFMRS